MTSSDGSISRLKIRYIDPSLMTSFFSDEWGYFDGEVHSLPIAPICLIQESHKHLDEYADMEAEILREMEADDVRKNDRIQTVNKVSNCLYTEKCGNCATVSERKWLTCSDSYSVPVHLADLTHASSKLCKRFVKLEASSYIFDTLINDSVQR